MTQHLSIKKVIEIFGADLKKADVPQLELQGELPPSSKFRSGAIFSRGWKGSELHLIGEKIGFFKKFEHPVALSVFTTKGGVLKSTLALNLARTGALHGLKTCVVGLDIQGDVTTALGLENDLEDGEDLKQIIDKLETTRGLSDFFSSKVRLNDIIIPSDLPKLFLIPETPELVALNDSLSNINRREFWLKEKIVDPLKEHFDLIVMDCSPNWNKLTTNALVACDALISPLECKINNFRNFKVFGHFLSEFKNEMGLDFENIFIPTKYAANKKLSSEIKKWYQENVCGCTEGVVRESVVGEESIALNLSVIEHAPKKASALEMRALLREVHHRVATHLSAHPKKLDKYNYHKTFEGDDLGLGVSKEGRV